MGLQLKPFTDMFFCIYHTGSVPLKMEYFDTVAEEIMQFLYKTNEYYKESDEHIGISKQHNHIDVHKQIERYDQRKNFMRFKSFIRSKGKKFTNTDGKHNFFNGIHYVSSSGLEVYFSLYFHCDE